MRKILPILVSLLAFFVFAPEVRAAVVVNEFSSASEVEWVELFNTSSTAAVDLTGWKLVPTAGSPTTVDLSGFLPRNGFLTFGLSAGTLADAGGAILLKDNTDAVVYAIYYGNISAEVGSAHVAAPSSSQSANAKESGGVSDGDWSVGEPSKGWCSSTVHQCPSISEIVSAITAGGVSTNLGSMADISRITGLYFEKSEYGKIAFSAEMNFTDQDATTWMQALDTKLSMSANTISLDADLIKNLVSTQAVLTMYNVNLSDPKILVDGADDTGGVVSGLSYDAQTKVLTFTAAHFTTFKAVNRGGGSSSTTASAGSASPPGCGATAPSQIPDLFQIVRRGSSATLYFTPTLDNTSEYVIAYGHLGNDWRYGTSMPKVQTAGVESMLINHLDPKATYWFTVRAGNGCATGNWSSWLETKPNKTTHKY